MSPTLFSATRTRFHFVLIDSRSLLASLPKKQKGVPKHIDGVKFKKVIGDSDSAYSNWPIIEKKAKDGIRVIAKV